tara:strand:- start:1331 stop:2605 length:1275 start_codon:yes stop_codon:yes gene_type:complete
MEDYIIKNVVESQTTLSLCRLMIENKKFYEVNTLLNSLIFNVINLNYIHSYPKNNFYTESNLPITKKYIFFVEGNGLGHCTQMLEIYALLQEKYNCVGIILGKYKKDIVDFANNKKIPILTLDEPEYLQNSDSDKLTQDTLKFLINYSRYQFKDVGKFIWSYNPDFFINLHLPIKIGNNFHQPLFNISSQNRLNFQKDYQKVLKYEEFEKYATDCVLFSSYVIHNSYKRLVKVAIDCEENSHNSIPPLIKKREISFRKSKNILCYFNALPPERFIRLISTTPFYGFTFHIFSSRKDDIKDIIQRYKLESHETHIKLYNCCRDTFNDLSNDCYGLISSCGVETIYEFFQLGLPMICVPSNPEQVFNAYDHITKIPGFHWTKKITKDDIDNIIYFDRNEDYWKKHNTFIQWISRQNKLETIIQKNL